jgi:hypothetical protein
MILKLGRGSVKGGVILRSTVMLLDTESGEGGCSVVGTSSTVPRAGRGVGVSH